MSHVRRLAIAMACLALASVSGSAQQPPDNLYKPVDNWAQLPAGRIWGSTSAVDIDPKGNIWVADRCTLNSCAGRTEEPIMQFDPSGKLLKSFGAGMFIFPHGIHVDRQGNVWVTDARGQDGKGHQVFKFSPDGKLLLTLGKAGVAGDGPDTFNQPSDVVVAATATSSSRTGTTTNSNARIVKFSKDGKFIKAWGNAGARPRRVRHVRTASPSTRGDGCSSADRGNNRIQIFDQDGQVPRGVEAVQPAERDLHRPERRDLRGRLRVEHASAIRAGSGASASAARRTARSPRSSPIRSRTRRSRPRAARKAWRRTPRATSTAPRSARKALKKYVKK